MEEEVMADYYGYDPSRFVPSFAGTAQAGAQIGKGLIGAGEAIEAQKISAAKLEKENEAIKLVNEDFSQLEDAYSSYVGSFKTKAKAAGWNDEQIVSAIQNIPPPTRTEFSKSPQATFRRLGDGFMKLRDQVETQARQQQLGGIAQQATTEQRGLRTTGFQPTERTETGFQKYEPKMEERVTEPVPGTREEATARFAAGAEGFQPTPQETKAFTGGMGQQFKTETEQLAQQREERLAEEGGSAATMSPQNFDDYMKELKFNQDQTKLELQKDKFEYTKSTKKLEEAHTLRTTLGEQRNKVDEAIEMAKDEKPRNIVVEAELKEKKKDLERKFGENESAIEFIKLGMEKAGTYVKKGETLVPKAGGIGGESPEKTKLYQYQAELQSRLNARSFEGTTEQEIKQLLQQIQDRINALTR